MKFENKLTEAIKIIPLAKMDKRLDMDSEISPVSHNLKSMPPMTQQFNEKPDVSIAGKKGKVYHENDDILREYTEKKELDDEDKLEDALGDEADEVEDALSDEGDEGDELEDILDDEDFDVDEMESELVSNVLPNTKYTINHVKGALDGMLGKWMELSINVPDGEKRRDFLEIGERLSEISAVLKRDFGDNNETM